MIATCPKGHSSSEADFCSECGARIAPPEQAASPVSTDDVCPDCHAKRLPESGKYCELCGYNFDTGAQGEIPTPEPIAQAVEPAPPAALEKWTVVITVDPALKQPDSPEPPADWSPLTIAADRETLLIGRTSQSRAIHPEVALDFDSAVSHRHAVLTRQNSHGWSVRDIGSSNGTRLNGQDLQAMTDVPVQAGDRITLGHWTCLTLSCEQ
jgi:hypothetical protein